MRQILSESRTIDVRLTIVRDIARITGGKNGGNAGIIETGGVRGAVLDLEEEAGGIST